jgi:anti-anti-sigma factor
LAEFQIETDEGDDGTAIKLAGELDSATAATVLEHFDRLSASGRAPLVLDLAALEFIDSAGLRSIIMIEQLASRRGVALSVVPPAPPLLELLDVTGLTERLSLATGVAEQLRHERFLERVEFALDRNPSAPRRARGELRRTFERSLGEMDLATGLLLTSELVTNAVLHPDDSEDGLIEVRITSYPDRLRVEVSDRGQGFDPDDRPERPPELGGRGLMVVDRLAARWGTAERSEGEERRFSVWYELDTGSARSESRSDAEVG